MAMERRRLRPRTRESYLGCVRRFIEWCQEDKVRLALSRTDRVSAYLSERAPNWAAKTQHVSLCALVWFHKHALNEPLGILPSWIFAKRPRRLPVWLTDSEARAVLAQLHAEQYLVGAIMYGSGLRVSEAFGLRRKDVNWDDATVTVRDGKGGKDRVSCLAKCLMEDLRAQDARAEAMHGEDRANGVGPVAMPYDVIRKYPNAGLGPGNFWLFPAHGLVRNKERWGNVRHHIATDTFAKAVVIATRRAGVLKHVKAHVFRHSFSTSMLMRGLDIRSLADLLGHASICTTQIYTHCIPKLAVHVVSPLDAEPSKVIQFAPPEPAKHLRAV